MFWKKSNYRKLDFIIIGTQKGGTTALDSYLRIHPDIEMASKKEIHLFDDEYNYKKRIINNDYQNFFDFNSNKLFYGECTPIYLYWKNCAKRIYKYNKNIKLISILRNPIERSFSHWNMETERLFETFSFTNAILNEKQRCLEAKPFQHKIFSYVDRGFYAKQIQIYLKYFSKNQMYFIKYEDFKKNQENYIHQTLQFIGADSSKYNFEMKTVHKRNYSTNINDEEVNYLKKIYEKDIKQLEKMLGWNCSDWLT